MDRRYQVYNRRRDTIFPFGPSIAPPATPQAQIERIDREEVVKRQAQARDAEHIPIDTVFYQYGELNPVRFPAAGQPVAIVAFTVPPGRILKVDRVQFWLSEPWCYRAGQFWWRPEIDHSQIPFVGIQGPPLPNHLGIPLWAFAGEGKIGPLYVQANSLFEVVMIERAPITTFTSYLVASCQVYGELLKPSGGEIPALPGG